MAHVIRHLLNRLPARRRTAARASGRRARPGSVLILVVALLVLMALMGTAWISTARTDRYATQQHAANTEIDLLVDGAVSMIKAALLDDLFGPITTPPTPPTGPEMYRPAPDPSPPGTAAKLYENYDYGRPLTSGYIPDGYLADREPVLLANGNPGWSAISNSMVMGLVPGATQRLPTFEDVLTGRPYISRTNMEVDFVAIGSRKYPALTDRSGGATNNLTFLAGDADGDGMADGGLARLPIGQINGLTYYIAVRVVDNNSGVNVNTALSSEHDFGGSTAGARFGAGDAFRSHTFFPTKVGLAEMLAFYAAGGSRYGVISQDLLRLNRYRWNDPTQSSRGPNGVLGGSANSVPVSDGMELRDDFRFLSMGDAVWTMLGNRIDNPGVVGAGPGGTTLRYRAFGLTDGGALAYGGGVVVNPEITPAPIETALVQTIGAAAGYPSQRFEPDLRTTWYPLFNPADPNYKIRHLLVTRNPVSNAAPWHAMPETGTFALTSGMQQTLTPAVAATLGGGALPQGMRPDEAIKLHRHVYPMLMPSNQQPGTNTQALATKASINTAEFGELWRAFYMVMAERLGGTPAVAADKMFRSPLRDPNVLPPAGGGAATAGKGLPPMNDLPLSPSNDTMLLRSAMAAVNAMDLRDSDHDVTMQRILLNITGGGTREVFVYGTERQPFITEVYANTDPAPNGGGPPVNPKGYVAVELHNPYPVPLSLQNWTLAVLVRRGTTPVAPPAGTTAYPQNLLRPITGFGGFPATTPMIPAGGYLVLENFRETTDVTPPGPFPATQRPFNAFPGGTFPPADAVTNSPQRVYVPSLHEVISDLTGPVVVGGELVLLRPRRGDNQLTPEVVRDPLNPTRVIQPAEVLASPQTLIPADAFDFTGLEQSTLGLGLPAAVPYKAIHYVRGNDNTQAWKFVYPGRWDPTHPWDPTATYPYRQEGTREAAWDPGGTVPGPTGGAQTTDPWIATGTPVGGGGGSSNGPVGPRQVRLGLADPFPSYTNDFPGIQLNRPDWAGPAKVPAAPNYYPFGAFPRNGDILQVPFFGAYKMTRPTATPPWGVADFEELSPVTMDCARADDNDTYTAPAGGGAVVLNPQRDDQYEMLGRFCPISAAAGPAPSPALSGNSAAYDWAADVFDYLTVQAPHDDYMPNVYPPSYNTLTTGGSVVAGIEPQPSPVLNVDGRSLPEVTWGRVQTGSATSITAMAGLPGPPDIQQTAYDGKYIVVMHNDGTTGVGRIRNVRFANNGATGRRATITLSGSGGTLFPAIDSGKITALVTPFKILGGDTTERSLGVDGLVNINTAPRRVLAALPMVVTPGTGRIDLVANTNLVDAIIARRQAMPFTSLFDLNQVVQQSAAANTFQNGMGTFNPATGDPGVGLGDYSPAAGGTDGVLGDFESRFLMMNRLSNLVTTRSDTFTCYVLVQGWRGVGSANPELVVQRRRAFMADRTGVTPTSRDVATQNFYNE